MKATWVLRRLRGVESMYLWRYVDPPGLGPKYVYLWSFPWLMPQVAIHLSTNRWRPPTSLSRIITKTGKDFCHHVAFMFDRFTRESRVRHLSQSTCQRFVHMTPRKYQSWLISESESESYWHKELLERRYVPYRVWSITNILNYTPPKPLNRYIQQ